MTALSRLARATLDALGRLTPLHLAWIHAKAALGVWAVLLVTYTPTVIQGALGAGLVWTVSMLTLSGSAISVVGLVMSAPDRATRAPTSRTARGLTVELFGLTWMFLGGIVMYAGVQFALTFAPSGQERISLTAFAYAFAAFVFCRIAMVTHRRRKEMRYLRIRGRG